MAGKSKTFQVPEAGPQNAKQRSDNGRGLQQPLSGSKKTKQHNHVSHNNPGG